MLCYSAVEAVLAQDILTFEQMKPARRNDQVHKPCHAANGTITVLDGDFLLNQDFELNPPTMAAAACIDQIHDTTVLITPVLRICRVAG